KETGHELTVLRRQYDAVPDGYTLLDTDPLDPSGVPLPPVYATPEPAAEQEKGYSDRSVADLKTEIERRNADRPEDQHIAVDGKGLKPDLVAALENDDNGKDGA
ncbi:hypothetical protein, partial [Nocardioides sp. ChNu-99]